MDICRIQSIPIIKPLNVDIDMPVDPHEPTYCFCNRVSFGEMVGCDNSDVSIICK